MELWRTSFPPLASYTKLITRNFQMMIGTGIHPSNFPENVHVCRYISTKRPSWLVCLSNLILLHARERVCCTYVYGKLQPWERDLKKKAEFPPRRWVVLLLMHYSKTKQFRNKNVVRGYPLITLAWFWPLQTPPPPLLVNVRIGLAPPPPPSLVVRILLIKICQ